MRGGATAVGMLGVWAAIVVALGRAEELRPLDPPLALEAAESAHDRHDVLMVARARGWRVKRRVDVEVVTRSAGASRMPALPVEVTEGGGCVLVIASAVGEVALRSVRVDPVPAPARDERFARALARYLGSAPLRRVVSSAAACGATRRYRAHVSLAPLAREGAGTGTVSLLVLFGGRPMTSGRDLPQAPRLDLDARPRGARAVSGPAGLVAGAAALAASWGGGALLLLAVRAAITRRRRPLEEAARADRRTARRLTVLVPRAMRAELEAILGDRGASEHARLARARNRLLAPADEIRAVGLATWVGPSARAAEIAAESERALAVIAPGTSSYRSGGAELAALTIVTLDHDDGIGGDALGREALDRERLEAVLRAGVPREAASLVRTAWRWAPTDPAAALDLEALDRISPGLLSVDAREPVERGARGAARRRCGCATSR